MEVAASVLTVAELGLSVSSTIYQYSASVRKADPRIKLLGNHVKYTSHVISELGRLFQQDSISRIISPSALTTAKEMVRDCDSLFKTLLSLLERGKKSKWKWPFKSGDADLHMADLERLKTTLNLLMSVLGVGHAMSTQQDKDVVAKLRFDVERLAFEKQYTTIKHDELKRQFDQMSLASSVSSHAFSFEPEKHVNLPQSKSLPTSQDLKDCHHNVRMMLNGIEDIEQILLRQNTGSENASRFLRMDFTLMWREAKSSVDRVIEKLPGIVTAASNSLHTTNPQGHLAQPYTNAKGQSDTGSSSTLVAPSSCLTEFAAGSGELPGWNPCFYTPQAELATEGFITLGQSSDSPNSGSRTLVGQPHHEERNVVHRNLIFEPTSNADLPGNQTTSAARGQKDQPNTGGASDFDTSLLGGAQGAIQPIPQAVVHHRHEVPAPSYGSITSLRDRPQQAFMMPSLKQRRSANAAWHSSDNSASHSSASYHPVTPSSRPALPPVSSAPMQSTSWQVRENHGLRSGQNEQALTLQRSAGKNDMSVALSDRDESEQRKRTQQRKNDSTADATPSRRPSQSYSSSKFLPAEGTDLTLRAAEGETDWPSDFSLSRRASESTSDQESLEAAINIEDLEVPQECSRYSIPGDPKAVNSSNHRASSVSSSISSPSSDQSLCVEQELEMLSVPSPLHVTPRSSRLSPSRSYRSQSMPPWTGSQFQSYNATSHPPPSSSVASPSPYYPPGTSSRPNSEDHRHAQRPPPGAQPLHCRSYEIPAEGPPYVPYTMAEWMGFQSVEPTQTPASATPEPHLRQPVHSTSRPPSERCPPSIKSRRGFKAKRSPLKRRRISSPTLPDPKSPKTDQWTSQHESLHSSTSPASREQRSSQQMRGPRMGFFADTRVENQSLLQSHQALKQAQQGHPYQSSSQPIYQEPRHHRFQPPLFSQPQHENQGQSPVQPHQHTTSSFSSVIYAPMDYLDDSRPQIQPDNQYRDQIQDDEDQDAPVGRTLRSYSPDADNVVDKLLTEWITLPIGG